jgi:hypothetical protein
MIPRSALDGWTGRCDEGVNRRWKICRTEDRVLSVSSSLRTRTLTLISHSTRGKRNTRGFKPPWIRRRLCSCNWHSLTARNHRWRTMPGVAGRRGSRYRASWKFESSNRRSESLAAQAWETRGSPRWERRASANSPFARCTVPCRTHSPTRGSVSWCRWALRSLPLHSRETCRLFPVSYEQDVEIIGSAR